MFHVEHSVPSPLDQWIRDLAAEPSGEPVRAVSHQLHSSITGLASVPTTPVLQAHCPQATVLPPSGPALGFVRRLADHQKPAGQEEGGTTLRRWPRTSEAPGRHQIRLASEWSSANVDRIGHHDLHAIPKAQPANGPSEKGPPPFPPVNQHPTAHCQGGQDQTRYPTAGAQVDGQSTGRWPHHAGTMRI